MTSRTPRRHRRLALMAAGTVAAMVLVPGTALAQENPINNVVDTLQQMAGAAGAPAAPDVPQVPAAPALPKLPVAVPGTGDAPQSPGVAKLPLDSSSDSPGHTTKVPVEPDHGSGFVGNVDLGKQEILDLTKYDATIGNDGTPHSDSTVLALLGNQLTGSSQDANGEKLTNPTDGIGKLTNGALSLSLLYHYVGAFQNDQGSKAAAAGGVLALCALGNQPVTASYECKGLLGAGAAEGLGRAQRDGITGHTKADSANEVLNACLGGERNADNYACKGPLGAEVLHSDSKSESKTPDTARHSWLVALDSGGNAILKLDQPTGLSIPPECGDSGILCLFLNQGKSIVFDHGAGSAQEALHLDLLKSTPLDVLVELGQAESIAHLVPPAGCNPGEKGPCGKPQCSDGIDNDGDGKIDFPADPDCKSPNGPSESPECSDGIDNDGDGKIDFPADPDCKSPAGTSESGNGNGAGSGNGNGLASTGADIAPLLAGAFALIGMGALTMAATRRRVGKHTI
ncbi:MAG: hypothetical protein ACRDSP_05230 [Pseudonocardiaceae bacterium]